MALSKGIHFQREGCSSFLKENSYVCRTISVIDPSLDMYAISLNELLTVINKNARHFQSKLMQVSTEENKIDEVVKFYFYYLSHYVRIDNVERKMEDGCVQPNFTRYDNTLCERAGSTKEYEKDKCDVKEDQESGKDALLMMWLAFPYYAVIHDRLDLIELCMETGYDMNVFRGMEGLNLLHVAVSKPTVNMEMIDKLLKHISVDTASALHMGVSNINITDDEILSLIIRFVEAGTDIGPVNGWQDTVIERYIEHLNDCIISGDTSYLQNGTWMKIIDMLSSYINERDVFGRTPLHWLFKDAADSSKTEQFIMIRDYLVQKGANISNLDVNENSMLHTAVVTLNLDIINYAITHKCPVNQLSVAGLSPLHQVCLVNKYSNDECDNLLLPILEVLVSAGAEINAQAIDGTTVLHHCVHALNDRVFKFLLKHGANVGTEDNFSRTLIHSAARNKNEHITNILRVLMEKGANINAQDKYGYTALHHAAICRNTNAAKSLLECGSNVLSKFFENKLQPLHLASRRGDLEMIHVLVEAGADINGKDIYGATPLHYAIIDGMPDITKTLIKCGADMESTDQLGQTPFTLALKMGQFKVAELLTNDPNEIRFGQLLSLQKRPPISSDDINAHFSGMKEELVSLGKAADISKSILSTPGLMRIDITRGENKTIHEQITSFAHAIASRIGELDGRFKGSIFPTGSIADGCKVGYPNEFDYLLNLDLIEECIDNVVSGPTGFVQLQIKPDRRSYVSEFLNQNRTLNSYIVYEYFRKLVVKASFDVHRHGFTGLQSNNTRQILIISQLATYTKLMPSVVIWHGTEYKGMDISLDINPVIKYKSWPAESIKTSTLLPDLQGHPLYLFPKSFPTIMNIGSQHYYMNVEGHWRYSFVYIEQKIFQNCTESLKNAFTLCKSLRMQPIIPAIIRKPAPVRNDTEQLAGDADNDNISSKHPESDTEYKMDVAYKSELKTLYDDDEQEEQDTINGEMCISVYNLKQIFMYEVEKIPIERRSDKNLIHLIPYRVFKELLRCYKDEMIPSYFMPKKNMLGSMMPGSQGDLIRLAMLQQVVAMLDKLGFGDDD